MAELVIIFLLVSLVSAVGVAIRQTARVRCLARWLNELEDRGPRAIARRECALNLRAEAIAASKEGCVSAARHYLDAAIEFERGDRG